MILSTKTGPQAPGQTIRETWLAGLRIACWAPAMSCTNSDVWATSVACLEISLLTGRFDALVTVGVPFLVHQRMVFADRESEGSVSKMVVVGGKEHAGVSVILPSPGSGDPRDHGRC